jgi:hypothetical protein
MKKEEIMGLVQTNEYLVFEAELGLAVIFDREMWEEHGEHKMKRVFKILDNGNVQELDVTKMVDDLATALMHTIDPKLLIKKVLEEMMPNDLIKAHKIITDEPERARTAKTIHHCLQIHIEDPKPGNPHIIIPIRY